VDAAPPSRRHVDRPAIVFAEPKKGRLDTDIGKAMEKMAGATKAWKYPPLKAAYRSRRISGARQSKNKP
jgi:hypothetical protein